MPEQKFKSCSLKELGWKSEGFPFCEQVHSRTLECRLSGKTKSTVAHVKYFCCFQSANAISSKSICFRKKKWATGNTKHFEVS